MIPCAASVKNSLRTELVKSARNSNDNKMTVTNEDGDANEEEKEQTRKGLPGKTEFQSFLQLLSQTLLGILRLGITDYYHRKKNKFGFNKTVIKKIVL